MKKFHILLLILYFLSTTSLLAQNYTAVFNEKWAGGFKIKLNIAPFGPIYVLRAEMQDGAPFGTNGTFTLRKDNIYGEIVASKDFTSDQTTATFGNVELFYPTYGTSQIYYATFTYYDYNLNKQEIWFSGIILSNLSTGKGHIYTSGHALKAKAYNVGTDLYVSVSRYDDYQFISSGDILIKNGTVSGGILSVNPAYDITIASIPYYANQTYEVTQNITNNLRNHGLKSCNLYAYIKGVNGNPDLFAGPLIIHGADCNLPSQPTGVNATDGSYTDRVDISWNGVANATSYEIYRDGIKIDNTQNTYTSDYNASTSNSNYCVYAINDCGKSSPSCDGGYKGTPTYPGIALSDDSGNGTLNFSTVYPGQTSSKILRIKNTGSAALTVSNMSYPQNYSGQIWTGTINAGSYKDITITYSPSGIGTHNVSLTVNSNAGNVNINLAGSCVNEPMADLIMYSKRLSSTSFNPGQAGIAYFKEKNQGDLAAAQHTAKLYISTTQDLTGVIGSMAGNVTCGYLNIGSISPEYSISFTVPSTIAKGNYYIVYFLDGSGDVPESNNSNNIEALAFSVSLPIYKISGYVYDRQITIRDGDYSINDKALVDYSTAYLYDNNTLKGTDNNLTDGFNFEVNEQKEYTIKIKNNLGTTNSVFSYKVSPQQSISLAYPESLHELIELLIVNIENDEYSFQFYESTFTKNNKYNLQPIRNLFINNWKEISTQHETQIQALYRLIFGLQAINYYGDNVHNYFIKDGDEISSWASINSKSILMITESFIGLKSLLKFEDETKQYTKGEFLDMLAEFVFDNVWKLYKNRLDKEIENIQDPIVRSVAKEVIDNLETNFNALNPKIKINVEDAFEKLLIEVATKTLSEVIIDKHLNEFYNYVNNSATTLSNSLINKSFTGSTDDAFKSSIAFNSNDYSKINSSYNSSLYNLTVLYRGRNYWSAWSSEGIADYWRSVEGNSRKFVQGVMEYNEKALDLAVSGTNDKIIKACKQVLSTSISAVNAIDVGYLALAVEKSAKGWEHLNPTNAINRVLYPVTLKKAAINTVSIQNMQVEQGLTFYSEEYKRLLLEERNLLSTYLNSSEEKLKENMYNLVAFSDTFAIQINNQENFFVSALSQIDSLNPIFNKLNSHIGQLHNFNKGYSSILVNSFSLLTADTVKTQPDSIKYFTQQSIGFIDTAIIYLDSLQNKIIETPIISVKIAKGFQDYLLKKESFDFNFNVNNKGNVTLHDVVITLSVNGQVVNTSAISEFIVGSSETFNFAFASPIDGMQYSIEISSGNEVLDLISGNILGFVPELLINGTETQQIDICKLEDVLLTTYWDKGIDYKWTQNDENISLKEAWLYTNKQGIYKVGLDWNSQSYVTNNVSIIESEEPTIVVNKDKFYCITSNTDYFWRNDSLKFKVNPIDLDTLGIKEYTQKYSFYSAAQNSINLSIADNFKDSSYRLILGKHQIIKDVSNTFTDDNRIYSFNQSFNMDTLEFVFAKKQPAIHKLSTSDILISEKEILMNNYHLRYNIKAFVSDPDNIVNDIKHEILEFSNADSVWYESDSINITFNPNSIENLFLFTLKTVHDGIPTVSNFNFQILDTLNLGEDKILCDLPNYQLETKMPNYFSLWSTNETTETISVNQNGMYFVEVTNPFSGFVERDTIVLQFNPKPAPLFFEQTAYEYCFGQVQDTIRANGTEVRFYGDSELSTVLSAESFFAPNFNETSTIYVTQTLNTCQSDPVSIQFIVNPIPEPYIWGEAEICNSQSNSFNFSTQSSPESVYTWTVTGGQIISGQSTSDINVRWYNEGEKLVIINETIAQTGCINSDTLHVLVSSLPNKPAKPNAEVLVCKSGTNAITPVETVEMENVKKYRWQILPANAGYISGSGFKVNIIWNENFTGIAVVSVIAENTCGTSEESESLLITVKSSPSAELSGGGTACEGESLPVIVKLTGTAPYSLVMSNGTSDTSITTYNAQYTYTARTTGSYSVVQLNDAYCSASILGESVSVAFDTVPSKPIILVNGETTFCEGGKTLLSAPAGYTNYLWAHGGNEKDEEITSSGSYKVKVYNKQCESEYSEPIKITVNPVPAQPTVTENGGVLTSNYTSGNQWFNANGAMPNETKQFFVVLKSDMYYVVVTENGCSSNSDAKFYVATDIDSELSQTIKLYPNPTSSVIYLDLNSIAYAKGFVKIHSTTGQVMNSIDLNGESHIEINLTDYSKGMYFINLTIDGKTGYSKFEVMK